MMIPTIRISEPFLPTAFPGRLAMRTEDSHSSAAGAADAEAPKRFGHYRVESALGQGGMGEVLLAWDERLERHVAIKRIRSDRRLDEQGRLRFRREARAVARLNHPAIVQIFDVLDTEDGECIVMEYVEGHSLARLLDEGPLELARALRLGSEIADGLRQAHAKGLVHRDLKPGNVIVTPAGRAKILDFGLARTAGGDDGWPTTTGGESLTESGALVGTVHAMSPEQASGRPVDHRSDLFALGGLLYEMLAGEAPFRGNNLLDTLWRVTNETPRPLAEAAPQVPGELARLVERLLAKDPSERPPNAGAVATELERLLALTSGTVATLPAPAPDPALLATLGDSASADGPPQAAIRVLVATGLVDGGKLPESLGDSRAAEVASRHDRMARDLLARFDGLEIDKRDGIFGLFERPADAVAFALEYHRRLDELSGTLDVELRAGIGVHLGEVFLRRNSPRDVARGAKPLEVDGLAKPLAARVQALAGGRQTLLTHGVFDLVRHAAVSGPLADPGLRWLAHGAYVSDPADEPLEIYEVGVEGLAPLSAPDDSRQAKRVVALGDELVLGWRPAGGQKIPRRPHWVLEERIGEGGFGEVWLARHKSGEERVFKFCFEAARLRALKREVTLFRLLKEALGHRDDIARVLDWNFDEAPYFLESEYTEGGSLVEWAKDQGGIAEVPLAVRLELVAQVAEALAAAHSVGILHKDVKPENVLIRRDRDGAPRARLTDFGIGLLTDLGKLESGGVTVMGFTESMELGEATSSGTLRYMAPELMAGRPATVQADVYSLGVMLYQLVVGDFSRPVASGWRRDVTDELLAEDVACFVDGSPERRPATALEVAERLRTLEERRQRHGEELRRIDEAETARRDLEKAQRRRRQSLAIAAAAVVVLAVVSVLALLAMSARREADRRRGQAESLIGFLLGDLRDKLEPVGRLDILDEVGDQALRYFASVPEADLSDQEVIERAEALSLIGQVRLLEGRPDAAMEAFQEALQLTRDLVHRAPDRADAQVALAQSHFWVARVFWSRGEKDQALEHWQSQLDVTRALAAADPENLDLQLEAAYADSNVGFALADRGDFENALAAYLRTLEVKQLVARSDATNPDHQLGLADQHNLVGWVLFRLGDLPEAERHFRAEHEIAAEYASRDPADTTWQLTLLRSHNFLGRTAAARGDFEEARRHHRRYLELALGLREVDPARTDWKHELALAHRWLAVDLASLGETGEALRLAREGVEILAELRAKDPSKSTWQRDAAIGHVTIGKVLEMQDRPDPARAEALTAVSLLAPMAEADPGDPRIGQELGIAYLLLGRAGERLGEIDRAREDWQRAAEVLGPLAEDSRNIELLEPWSEVLGRLGRHSQSAVVAETLGQLKGSG
jgi:serine/threonine-protein kinase